MNSLLSANYPTGVSPERVYYPSLDYLRGLAILAVMLYHNFAYLRVFGGGWMGVDLFFVLSGFLITDLLIRSVGGPHYFRNFFVRRMLRIFPLYYLFLALFFALLPLVPESEPAGRTAAYYQTNQAWFWTYLQNWLMIKNGHAAVPYLSHFWSLAVEEQFYILWPFFIYALRRSKYLLAILFSLMAAVFIYRQRVWHHNQLVTEAFFYNTFCRMDSLLAGGIVAVCLKENNRIPRSILHTAFLSFGMLLVAALFIYGNIRQDKGLFGTIGYSVSAAFFAALVYWFVTKEERLQRLLSHLSFLRFLGKISYGLYVFHFPVDVLLGTQFSVVLTHLTGKRLYSNLLVSFAGLFIALLLSLASYYGVEKPALRLRRYFS